MDEPKPPVPESGLPAPLAEVPDEFPEGLLEADGTFVPDYDPPVRPFGVWVAAGIAFALSVWSVEQALIAVTHADMTDFLINAATAWTCGYAGYGTFRGNPRGHTTYVVFMLVVLVVLAAATVFTAVVATNSLPSLLRMLSGDPLVQEFIRNAALALVAGFALSLALCGLLLTYLESDRVREWVGKETDDTATETGGYITSAGAGSGSGSGGSSTTDGD